MTSPPAVPQTPALPLASLCVLVVEDMPDELRMLARFLGDAGARVLMAVQGDEALRLAKLMRPDVVLLDVRLPPPDGLRCAARCWRSRSRPTCRCCSSAACLICRPN